MKAAFRNEDFRKIVGSLPDGHDYSNQFAVHAVLGRTLTCAERKFGALTQFRKNWWIRKSSPKKPYRPKVRAKKFEASQDNVGGIELTETERKNLRNRRRRGKFGFFVPPTSTTEEAK